MSYKRVTGWSFGLAGGTVMLVRQDGKILGKIKHWRGKYRFYRLPLKHELPPVYDDLEVLKTDIMAGKL